MAGVGQHIQCQSQAAVKTQVSLLLVLLLPVTMSAAAAAVITRYTALLSASLFAFVVVHSPLVMDKAANAESENSDSCCDRYQCGEDICGNIPACQKADQTSGKTEDGYALVKLLLLPIFVHISRVFFLEEIYPNLHHGIVSEQ
ncbi:hypothetical protein H70357_16585 [Paenibacillus sp. FSL H7-0357]|nr:hypothetical protein H70357_16585 [Paenibacillus sp. FSL H7-0357]